MAFVKSLFSQQSDSILQLLTVAVPVLEILHILQRGEVEGRDAHLDDVFLGTGVADILVVQAEVHLHVTLCHGQLVVGLGCANGWNRDSALLRQITANKVIFKW